MPILSNPGPFTFEADPVDLLTFSGIGPIRKRDQALTVDDIAGQQNHCRLTIGDHEGTSAPEPGLGQNVEIGTLGQRIFVGTVTESGQRHERGVPSRLKWDVDLLDPTWQLNRLIPFGAYSGSASTVVADLLTDWGPDFTGANVEASLPDVVLDLDGSSTFGGVLDNICEQLGGAVWKVDYDFDLHLNLDPETTDLPGDLEVTNTDLMIETFTYGRSLSQIQTRCFIRGTGCFATVDDAAAQAALAVMMGGDGVREGPVIAVPDFTTEAECTAFGEAYLSIRGFPITWIDYYSRDPRSVAGKTVIANLPAVTGSFLIQSVHLDQIGEHLGTMPRYHVRASSVRFSLEQILRGFAQQRIVGNSGTTTALQTPRGINGVLFGGTSDITAGPSAYLSLGGI